MLDTTVACNARLMPLLACFHVQEQAEKFQQYALLCMEDVAGQGKPVKPIELHLTKRSSGMTVR
jgi:hypothetical protein